MRGWQRRLGSQVSLQTCFSCPESLRTTIAVGAENFRGAAMRSCGAPVVSETRRLNQVDLVAVAGAKRLGMSVRTANTLAGCETDPLLIVSNVSLI